MKQIFLPVLCGQYIKKMLDTENICQHASPFNTFWWYLVCISPL